jgi:hypothetical protein
MNGMLRLVDETTKSRCQSSALTKQTAISPVLRPFQDLSLPCCSLPPVAIIPIKHGRCLIRMKGTRFAERGWKYRKTVPESMWPNLTEAEKDVLYEESSGVCRWCEKPIARSRYGKFSAGCWVADHVIPRSNPRTSNDLNNLVASCRSCNASRQDRSEDDFEEEWENDSVMGDVYDLTPVGHRGVRLFGRHRTKE